MKIKLISKVEKDNIYYLTVEYSYILRKSKTVTYSNMKQPNVGYSISNWVIEPNKTILNNTNIELQLQMWLERVDI